MVNLCVQETFHDNAIFSGYVKKNRLIIAFVCPYPLLDLHKLVHRVRISHVTVRRIIREKDLRL